MSFLGTIVSKRKLKDLPEFVENVTSVEELSKSHDLPTLFVGYGFMSDNGVVFDIMDKHKVDNASMWTYSKTERRDDYEADVKSFVKSLIASHLERLHYKFIPLSGIIKDKDRKKEFYALLNTEGDKCCYIAERMMYVGIGDTSYGISLQLLEYLGVSKSKFEKYVRGIDNMKVIDEEDFNLGNMVEDLKIADMYKPFVYSAISA